LARDQSRSKAFAFFAEEEREAKHDTDGSQSQEPGSKGGD
jgi:hypothetical protein